MMKKRFSKLLSFLLTALLIVAMAVVTVGCEKDSADGSSVSDKTVEATVLGEGETKFSLTVTESDGTSADFLIYTDQTTVGDALLNLGFISGEESQYGLYVDTVNGITVDNKTAYWAFCINGEYAMTGVDSTKIEEDAQYTLTVEEIK